MVSSSTAEIEMSILEPLLSSIREDEIYDKEELRKLLPSWKPYRIRRDRCRIGFLEFSEKNWRFPGLAILNFITGENGDPLGPLLRSIDPGTLYPLEWTSRRLKVKIKRLADYRRMGIIKGLPVGDRVYAYPGAEICRFLQDSWRPPRDWEE